MARKTSRRTFGSISKLPSGRYRASYLGPDGQRHAAESTFGTVGDADAWLAVISTSITKREWRPPEPARETFGAFATRWLELGMARNGKPLSPTTQELYGILWKKWLKPTFADIALGDLTKEHFRVWLARCRKSHPDSTQPDKAFRLARTVLNVALDDGKILVNPCRIPGAGREESPERPVAEPGQVLALAGAIDDRYHAMVILGAWCSLRFGELAGLRRKRVDLLHRRIDVAEQAVELGRGQVVFKTPKWGSERVVDVPADVVAILEHHLAEYVGPDPDALVFTSPEGHSLRRTKFRPRWAEACQSVGVDYHFHDLRGSGATWAAQQGATVAELQARLGHRTVAAAMRYQHSTEQRGRVIADRLGALLQPDEAAEPSNVTAIR